MNFALFGFDPLLAQLTRALRQHETHCLRWACNTGPFQSDLKALDRDIVFLDRWEDLAGETAVDAVLVASCKAPATREEEDPAMASEDPVRRLAQAGKHLLLARAETLPLMAYYELALIGEENGAVIMPIHWERLHPAFESFGAPNRSSHDGPLRHVSFWRCVAPLSPPAAGQQGEGAGDRSSETSDASLEANRRLHAYFAGDALLLRFLAADFTHVTSLLAPKPRVTDRMPTPTDQVAVCVSMVGARGDLSTWTCVSTSAHTPMVRLTATTDTAITTFEWADLRCALRRTIASTAGWHTKHFGPWNPAEGVLNRFLAAVEGKEPASDLADATRCSEVTEAAVRSLRRGRGVELRHNEQTESSTFKGAMTSVGCGLLGIVFFALMITAVAEGLGLGWIHYAWYGIVPLLVLFLFLQLLGLAFPRSETEKGRRRG